ncbi:hypothetical protein B296_00029098 [Ensete ventricosum]|uniref:Uncharacterized protein n=1 Tax=Ensete ventricosum TaxID=4639 RepID=A0A426ZHG6_ENSVE|nr:hypothetical protein B296_00029098 [Ensete ventricosum]
MLGFNYDGENELQLDDWAKIKLGYRAKVRTMQWELAGSLLGVRRRNWEAHWEHTGRSPEEDHKTRRNNVGGYWIGGSGCQWLDRPGQWLYRPYPVFKIAFDGDVAGADGCTAHTRFFKAHLNFGSIFLKQNGVYKYPKFSCI